MDPWVGRTGHLPWLKGTGTQPQAVSGSTVKTEVFRPDHRAVDGNVSPPGLGVLDCSLTMAGGAGAEFRALLG